MSLLFMPRVGTVPAQQKVEIKAFYKLLKERWLI
jgi:hypothetical protein